jgi:hypothetical protein
VLLCKTKDNEVVEYALSRSMSPALIAEYQTRLPDKKLLQAKLHEFYELAETASATSAEELQRSHPKRKAKSKMGKPGMKPSNRAGKRGDVSSGRSRKR